LSKVILNPKEAGVIIYETNGYEPQFIHPIKVKDNDSNIVP
jgi:hypothetical protein